MQILRKGNPNEWEIETVCTNLGYNETGCGSLLLVSEYDLYITRNYVDSSKILKTYCFTYKCPVCGKENVLSNSIVPNSVKRRLLEEYIESNKWFDSSKLKAYEENPSYAFIVLILIQYFALHIFYILHHSSLTFF